MSFKLKKVSEQEKQIFIQDIQEAFQKGYEDYFGKCKDTVIPKQDILQSFNGDGSCTFLAYEDDVIVGGVNVCINKKTQVNHLDLLYVKVGAQSKGVGFKIWNEIERLFPDTLVWKTCTPYFDRRNINFYVNKCHFKIIEFINKYHPGPERNEEFIGDGNEGMFEFEKVMK